MKNSCIATIVLIFSISLIYSEKPEKEKDYQPLPPGPYFFNNNSQNFTVEERRKEVRMNSQQPPVVIYTQPQPPPSEHIYHQETSCSDHSQVGSKNYQPFNPTLLGFFWSRIKELPELLTVKNCLIACGTAACGYGALYFIIQYRSKQVMKNNGWGSFQEHIPPSDLKTLDELALAEGIIEEIKARYPLINPANLMPSILLFNKDVEKELEMLHSFITLMNDISYYHLTAVFPNQEKTLLHAQTKIQRLHILRDAILSWINTHVVRLMRNQPISHYKTV